MVADATSLPEGTVTVLSTDLVGSTQLNQRLGDEAGTALEREIAELANTHIEKQRGVMITYAGDGLEFLWNFDLFQNAITATVED